MRKRIHLAVLAAVVIIAAADVAGQARQTRPPVASAPQPAAGGVPRVADGHPDLQGTYDLAWGTSCAARG